MKRWMGVLAICFVLAAAVASQTQSASPRTEKLSKQQLLSLIATASKPAEHRRIARYYEGQAKYLLAQAKEHEELGEAYKKNPMTSSSKFATGTVDHCVFFAKSFKDDAAKMQELAGMHEQMAKDAEHK